MSSLNILIIHPYDRSTFFLKRIKNYLQVQFGSDVYYFSVKPNDTSHHECLERIKQHPNSGLIIFLGHGRTDRLYGGKSEKYSALVSDSARLEISEEYYYNENFINESNIDVLKSKKIFCLACNSNSRISDYAIQKEALAFLGFGDIPTTIGEFKEKGKNVSNDVIRYMKTEINHIIKKCLAYSIKNEYSFRNLFDLINLTTNQRIMYYLKYQKYFKERYLLTDYLYFFKKEIKIKGDKNIKLIG